MISGKKICMYGRTNVRMYVCMCVYACVFKYISVYVHVYVHVNDKCCEM